MRSQHAQHAQLAMIALSINIYTRFGTSQINRLNKRRAYDIISLRNITNYTLKHFKLNIDKVYGKKYLYIN